MYVFHLSKEQCDYIKLALAIRRKLQEEVGMSVEDRVLADQLDDIFFGLPAEDDE
ncbi:hypothetical protein [Mesorhizobium sp.]|uniref:hypothetical protein n=1 Tax=Mesorhizobium sp. TaxID=1871066 RepID=UPI00257BC76C|nr:hypothetical protein [Mesorhizobium sp.]